MAPKKGKPEVEKADQCLQAVVVAEAYDGAFRPVGLPNGRPMGLYTPPSWSTRISNKGPGGGEKT